MTYELGIKGEEYAVLYLKNKGYKVLERNYRIRNGEIDIIAIDKSSTPHALVFIEVKTRKSKQFGLPIESITPHKQRFLKRTALYYCSTHQNLPEYLRIDAISIMLSASERIEDVVHEQNIVS